MRIRLTLLVVLFLSAVYLFAWPAPTLFYAGIVLLHVAAGLVFTFVIVVRPAWLKIFRNACLPKQAAGWGWLMGGAGLGVLLIFTGARRHELPLLYAHIGACLVGVALLAAHWAGTRGWLSPSRGRAVLRYAIFLLGAA